MKQRPIHQCALCILRIGLGVKTVRQLTCLGHNTIQKLRAIYRIPISNRLLPQNQKDLSSWQWRAFALETHKLRWTDEQHHWRDHPECKSWYAPQRALQSRLKSSQYYHANKQRINRRITDIPHLNLKRRLRTRIRVMLTKNKQPKYFSTQDVLGCSYLEFREWIQSQFTKGMSWENMGEWHIDHIIPCASFDLLDDKQLKQCFHYTNLRPLWADDNRAKHDKVPTNAQLALVM